MAIDLYGQLRTVIRLIREEFAEGCVPDSVEGELTAAEILADRRELTERVLNQVTGQFRRIYQRLRTPDFLCIWACRDRRNALNEFLYSGTVLSMNVTHTLEAIERHAKPDATGWYFLDFVSLVFREKGIGIEMNVIHPYGQPDDSEYWHLCHVGGRRDNYRYVEESSGEWTGILFDINEYQELRKCSTEVEKDSKNKYSAV